MTAREEREILIKELKRIMNTATKKPAFIGRFLFLCIPQKT